MSTELTMAVRALGDRAYNLLSYNDWSQEVHRRICANDPFRWAYEILEKHGRVATSRAVFKERKGAQ